MIEEGRLGLIEGHAVAIERVYEAYCGKNKINYQRLKEGY